MPAVKKRPESALSSFVSALWSGLRAACNENRKGVARTARADGDADVLQARGLQPRRQFLVVDPEPPVVEALAHPRLIVASQIEYEHAPAGPDDADGFAEGA